MGLTVNNHKADIYQDNEMVVFLDPAILQRTGNKLYLRVVDLEEMAAWLRKQSDDED